MSATTWCDPRLSAGRDGHAEGGADLVLEWPTAEGIELALQAAREGREPWSLRMVASLPRRPVTTLWRVSLMAQSTPSGPWGYQDVVQATVSSTTPRPARNDRLRRSPS